MPIIVSHGQTPTPAPLDETNQKILQMLAYQARSTMQDIAFHVGRSESTVRERLVALEHRGVVIGYEARIDWGLVGLPVQVFFQGHCKPAAALQLAAQLQMIPNVVQAIITTGAPNVVVVARARDIHDVNTVRMRLAAAGLEDVEARIALESLVAERPPVSANETPQVLRSTDATHRQS